MHFSKTLIIIIIFADRCHVLTVTRRYVWQLGELKYSSRLHPYATKLQHHIVIYFTHPLLYDAQIQDIITYKIKLYSCISYLDVMYFLLSHHCLNSFGIGKQLIAISTPSSLTKSLSRNQKLISYFKRILH